MASQHASHDQHLGGLPPGGIFLQIEGLQQGGSASGVCLKGGRGVCTRGVCLWGTCIQGGLPPGVSASGGSLHLGDWTDPSPELGKRAVRNLLFNAFLFYLSNHIKIYTMTQINSKKNHIN